jgi:hypothetical protein
MGKAEKERLHTATQAVLGTVHGLSVKFAIIRPDEKTGALIGHVRFTYPKGFRHYWLKTPNLQIHRQNYIVALMAGRNLAEIRPGKNPRLRNKDLEKIFDIAWKLEGSALRVEALLRLLILRSKEACRHYEPVIRKVAKSLCEQETLSCGEILAIMNGYLKAKIAPFRGNQDSRSVQIL